MSLCISGLNGSDTPITTKSLISPQPLIIINVMEQSLLSRSAGQEILRLLLNPKVHLLVTRSLQLDPILSQLNPVHALNTLLSSSLRVGLGFRLYFVWISQLPYACIRPVYLMHFNLTILIVFHEKYELWSPYLWCFLHYSVTSLVRPLAVPSQILYSQSVSSLKDKVLHPHKMSAEIRVLCIVL
jgi:hypothetical protein